MIDLKNYDKAIIVTGDGDFSCLATYLRDANKLDAILVPNGKSYSALLKKVNRSDKKYVVFMNELKNKLEYKKRAFRGRNP